MSSGGLPPWHREWVAWPRRLRVRFGGETVADTRGAHVLRQHGFLPVFYLPLSDVRQDLLEPSAWTTHSPYRGTATSRELRRASARRCGSRACT